MKKKILSIFLACMMIFSVLPTVVFAEDHVHTNDVEPEAPACPGQDEKHTLENCPDAEAYDVVDAECGKWGYTIYKCPVCTDYFAADFVKGTEHVWKVTKDEVKATCAEDGAKAVETCELCGEKRGGDVTEKLGHDWVEVDRDGDCMTKGFIYYKCSRCNEEKKESTDGTGIGHIWSDKPVEIKEEPTCGASGVAVYECTVCHEKKEVEILPTGNHTLKEHKRVNATCTEDGTIAYWECEVCHAYFADAEAGKEVEKDKDGKYKIVIPALGHDIDDDAWTTVTAPTCTETGLEKATCPVCKKEVERTVKAKGHSYDPNPTKIEPTCTTWGFDVYACIYCGEVKNTNAVKPLGHTSYDDKTSTDKNEVAATCTTDGARTWICGNCHKSQTEVITKTGHNEVTVTVDATCKRYGYVFTYCTNDKCPEKAVEAYTFDGVDYDVKIQDKPVKLLNIKFGKEFNPENHRITTGDITPPTCTKDGYRVGYCEDCSYYATQTVPALGHDFNKNNKDNIVETHPATCTEDGYMVVKCNNGCGETQNVPTEDKATGHKYPENGVVVAPTCKADGYTAFECEVCHHIEKKDVTKFDASKGEYTKEEAATTHPNCSFVKHFREGNCTKVGLDLYYCPDCGKDILVVIDNTGKGHVPPEAIQAPAYDALHITMLPSMPSGWAWSGNAEMYTEHMLIEEVPAPVALFSEALNENTISISQIGYPHGDAKGVIVMAGDNQTIGQITERGVGKEKDPTWWTMLLVNSDNVVTKILKNGDNKKDIVCPEGYYILAAWSDPSCEEAFKALDAVPVESTIHLNNVNLDKVRTLEGFESLENAVLTYTPPTNLAQGIDGGVKGHGNYTADLTDGAASKELSFTAEWFALYYNGDTNVTNAPKGVGTLVYDLGELYQIDKVRINTFLGNSSAGIKAPKNVLIEYSADGKEYTKFDSKDFVAPAAGDDTVEFVEFIGEVSVKARYVKITITLQATFAFLNEVLVIGEKFVEPEEPSEEPSEESSEEPSEEPSEESSEEPFEEPSEESSEEPSEEPSEEVTVKVDGVITEEEWNSASTVSNAIWQNKINSEAHVNAEYSVRADDKYVYVAIKVDMPWEYKDATYQTGATNLRIWVLGDSDYATESKRQFFDVTYNAKGGLDCYLAKEPTDKIVVAADTTADTIAVEVRFEKATVNADKALKMMVTYSTPFIPASGTATPAIEPTCTEDGKTSSYVCTSCGEFVKFEVVKALGHDWKITDEEPATCTKPGTTEIWECKRCGEIDPEHKGEPIPMIKHDWNKTDGVPATCEKDGVNAKWECKVCKKVDEENNGKTIPAIKHANMKKVDSGVADCENFGYTHNYCPDCGKEFIDDYTAALGHKWNPEIVKPDCENPGKKVCDVCKKEEAIPANGHKNKAGEKLVDDCKDTVEDRLCVDCKKEIGHKHNGLVQVHVEATCLEYGYDLELCENCGWSEVKNVDDTHYAEHAFGEWTVTKAPTFTEAGEEKRECNDCGETETRPVAQLTGVQFAIDIDNAVVSGAGYADSSLVAVKVSLNTTAVDVWGVRFNVNYDAADVSYVGYKFETDKLISNQIVNNVTNDDGAFVSVMATVPNTADGKTQNTKLEGTEDFVVLYFRITLDDVDVTETAFSIEDADIRNNNTEDGAINYYGAEETIEIEKFLDVNDDGSVDLADALIVQQMITGEIEMAYHVAADVDKSGIVDYMDLNYIYEYIVYMIDYDELVTLGVKA